MTVIPGGLVARLRAVVPQVWNALVSKRAIRVEAVRLGPNTAGIQFLHPTKGWRFVSDRRLGLA